MLVAMLDTVQLARLARTTQVLASVPEPDDRAGDALRRRRGLQRLFAVAWVCIFLLMLEGAATAPGLFMLGVLAIFAYGAYTIVTDLAAIKLGLTAPIERQAVAVVDRRVHTVYRGPTQHGIVIEDASGQRRELRALPGADTAVVGDVGVVFVRGPWLWGFAPVA